MFLGVGIVHIQLAQLVDFGKLEVLGLGDAQHLLSLGSIQKLALLVKQLQGIPLLGVMAGRQDNTAASLLHGNRNFGGRRGGQPDVYHIEAHTHEGTDYGVFYHFAGNTGIASYYNLIGLYR